MKCRCQDASGIRPHLWAGMILVAMLGGCGELNPDGIFPNLVPSGVERGSIGIQPLVATIRVGEKLEVEASFFLDVFLPDHWWIWDENVLELRQLSCPPPVQSGSKWTGRCRAEVTGRKPGESGVSLFAGDHSFDVLGQRAEITVLP